MQETTNELKEQTNKKKELFLNSIRANHEPTANRRITEFFFFQAEDGIRAPLVTGVQTCALPISQATLGELGPDGAILDEPYATEHNLQVGSSLSLTTVAGTTLPLTVRGIFKPAAGGSPFGNVTISTVTFDATNPQPQNLYTFLKMQGGVTDANTAALNTALKSFPNAKAQT